MGARGPRRDLGRRARGAEAGASRSGAREALRRLAAAGEIERMGTLDPPRGRGEVRWRITLPPTVNGRAA
jgi:hypothetical protein